MALPLKLKRRLLSFGIFGGAATGIGGLGAFGVCHSLCTAVIAVLAAIGITGIAMPFTFLQNRWFIITSLVVGVGSLLVAFGFWIRMRRQTGHHCSMSRKLIKLRRPQPLTVISVIAVLLLAINELLILDAAAAASGEPGLIARTIAAARGSSSGQKITGNLENDAIALVLATGTPDRYGAELGVVFPNPADQQAMNAMMAKMSRFDPAYGSAKIALAGALKERYTKIGLRISCEFCCGAKAIVFENGEAACGCAHSQAMRGLAAYLLEKHADKYTDDEILRELARWKGLYFPKQMVAKLTSQTQSGQYTPDIAALLVGIPEDKLKAMGAQAASLPKALEQMPNMSGGC